MTCEAVHCFDKATVRFAMYPDGPDGTRVLAEISEDALRDVFGACGDGSSLVAACKTHFDLIEACALMHFRRNPLGSLDLGVDDFCARSVSEATEALPLPVSANANRFSQSVVAG